MKKEVINDDQFESLCNMLNSSDDQNVVLGLVTLENVDFTKSLTKILLLRKVCDVTPEYWKEHAPKTFKKLKSVSQDKPLTYKEILKIIVKEKQSEENIQFFLNQFSKHITNSIKDLGFDFIEETEITIKLKNNDKTGITSQSI
jgi:hypothetical protein